MLHEGHVIAHGSVDNLDRNPDELVRAFMMSQHAG